MAPHARAAVGVRLWPQRYAIARLLAVPDPFPTSPAGGPPIALIADHDEVSLVAPEEVVEAQGGLVERVGKGWRALTLDATFPLTTVGLLAVVSRALADVGIPLMVLSSYGTDHFLVPDETLGRALAALGQARLERFLPEE
ncbi:MAG: ACT domain-containing protein [Thermoanaerobaculaceae bacterium]|nr:ACT domain-containing protein [Thermoanaerobaculaceae bacterium]TAM54913.1 MAG: ACT domain-containing protein [Acidobacteriota bacterium]